jgi:ribonuclease M5
MKDGLQKEKLKLDRAIVVEGRDDVAAVSRAADALIIPTHGFGITGETWKVIAKAYEEKGLVILTDPDHAGEQIRRMLTERFPEAVQAYIATEDAAAADDIGVENAQPEVIREALAKALARGSDLMAETEARGEVRFASMNDLRELGLAGCGGAAEKRAAVCKNLGIGYGNASAMIKKLKGFGIGIDELREEVEKSGTNKR